MYRLTKWQAAIAIPVLFLILFAGTAVLHIKHFVDINESWLARVIEATVIRPWDKITYVEQPGRFSAFAETAGRMEIPCARNGTGVAILFVMGQSNAANSGKTHRKGLPGVQNFNFLDGKCYTATDPLLGATGTGGSLWTELGNRLVQSGKYHHVVLAPVAVSGTSINRWSDPRDLGARISKAGESLKIAGLKPTSVLVIQGEADFHAEPAWAMLRTSEFVRLSNGDNRYSMRTESYQQHFLLMKGLLRDSSIEAPVSIALKSRCGEPAKTEENPVSQAQRELIRIHPDILAGPDLDAFGTTDYRSDLCHLSDQGLEQAAQQWSSLFP
jgi:hypothetical protein